MKRTLLALATTLSLASAFSASASVLDEPPAQEPSNWEISVNYHNITTETDSAIGDIDTGVVSVGFAYQIMQEGGHLSISPELLIGKGVQSDDIAGVEIEVDSMINIGTRFTLHPTDKFEVFLRPSYTKLTSDEFNEDWEFGLGAGVGLNVTEKVNVSLSFDRIASDSDVMSATLRYRF